MTTEIRTWELINGRLRETKGTLDEQQLRGMEERKIHCARRHFEAIEVDYDVVAKAEDLGRRG